MDHRQDRVVKQKAAKAVSHRQLQVSHAHIYHRVVLIHGLVVHGVHVRLRGYKVEVVVKHLTAQALKRRRRQPINIVSRQIDQHNKRRQAVLMKF